MQVIEVSVRKLEVESNLPGKSTDEVLKVLNRGTLRPRSIEWIYGPELSEDGGITRIPKDINIREILSDRAASGTIARMPRHRKIQCKPCDRQLPGARLA